MYKKKRILALIPARGGSKRLAGKNVRLFLGKPLIARTIEQAKKSRYIDTILVSTDDRKISAISKAYGASVPFLRPANLATDTASSIDVLLHAIDWLGKKGAYYDLIVLLQPTSPLRTNIDINHAVETLFSKKAKAIVSVYKTGRKPLWSGVLPEDCSMKDFMKKNKTRSNDSEYYTLNGAIYLGYTDYIKRNKGFMGSRTFAYIMPQERSVDIDDKFDFWMAEQILKK